MAKIKFVDKLAILFASIFLNILFKTLRIIVLEPNLREKSEKPRILAFWHGKLILPMILHQSQGIFVMASQHRDGEMIAQVARKLGIDSVRGSSTRGGGKALAELVEKIYEGHSAALTPDGPKGPRHKIKFGTLRLSAETDSEIHLLNCYMDRKWVLNSWDKFEFPKPFSKIIVAYQLVPPIKKDASLVEEAERLEKAMEILENECHDALKKN